MAVRKGITRKKKSKDSGDGPKELTSEDLGGLDPKIVEDFMRGRITLGEMQGFDKGSQGKVAAIGLEYLENGKLIEAQNVFTGLLAMDPYEPFYFEALGSICQRREEWTDAEAWYSRSLEAAAEKNTRSPSARANRGEVRLMMQRLEDAVDDLTQAIIEDPDFKEPTTERARMLLTEVKRQIDEAQEEANSQEKDKAE
ncbi:MAG: tetratricopeptide repeat protein [Deltaproteobacteria bacterium]|nr:tetratricopeptide repeat protein [Deltaproteobacteria bacterium]